MIADLYRYPVKGLSGEPLARVSLSQGEAFPFDRAYAIENGPSGFDPAEPKFLSKPHFLMLMKNQRLAALSTHFDDASAVLTIDRDGKRVAEGCLDTEAGRKAIEAFFADYESDELRGPPRLLSAPGHSFADCGKKVISLINLASVGALEERIGAPVQPLRFRGNVYVEGLAPWQEFDWVGRRVAAGGVVLEARERINRCVATNVNPETAERDMTIPRTLSEAYGHMACGIYLKVAAAGEIAVGDAIEPL